MTDIKEIFADQEAVVETFNKELEELAKKHGVRGVEKSACAAFANSIMEGADNNTRKALLKVWEYANEDFIKNMKRRVQLESIAKILGKDIEYLIGPCDCENCKGPEEVNLDDSEEDRSDLTEEQQEEDPRSVVDRENGEAAHEKTYAGYDPNKE